MSTSCFSVSDVRITSTREKTCFLYLKTDQWQHQIFFSFKHFKRPWRSSLGSTWTCIFKFCSFRCNNWQHLTKTVRLNRRASLFLLWISLLFYLCMFRDRGSVRDNHKVTNSGDAVMSATVNECHLCSSSAYYVRPICCFIFIYLSPSWLWFCASSVLQASNLLSCLTEWKLVKELKDPVYSVVNVSHGLFPIRFFFTWWPELEHLLNGKLIAELWHWIGGDWPLAVCFMIIIIRFQPITSQRFYLERWKAAVTVDDQFLISSKATKMWYKTKRWQSHLYMHNWKVQGKYQENLSRCNDLKLIVTV